MQNERSLPKHPVPANPENVKEGDGTLERLAKVIDPPGNEVDGQDLNDPGRMTPGAPPVDNRS
jgi:hypothetical protein